MKLKKIKYKILVITILFVISICNVYASDIIALRYGGKMSDYFQDVIVDDGLLVAVGTTASTDIEGLTNIGQYDSLIVKYDETDSIVWQKNYGTTNSDSLNSIISVDDGYIAVGYKNDSKNGTGLDSTAVIVKIDKNGNLIWEKEYKKYDGTIFADVEQTSNEEYIVIGTAYNEDAVVPILIKYTSTGDVQLEKELSDYEEYSLKKVILSEDNGYTLLLSNGTSSVILNLTEDGTEIWYQEYDMEGIQHPVFEDGILTTNNTYLVVGGNHLHATPSGSTIQDFAFILEYDKNGKLLTENIFKEYKQSRFNRVIEIENRYVVIGQFANLQRFDISNAVTLNFDVKVLKFDYNKKLIDEESTGVKSSYTLYNDSFSVAKLTDNDYFVVLNTTEDLLGTTKKGNYDAAILKTKNVFEPEPEIEIPDEDIIDDAEKVEVPDTLSNSSIALIVIGALLIAGGVILYFVVLKKRNNKI